jgi:hypothetical protein
MLDLFPIFEAVDKVPGRAVEQHRGPGRIKRGGSLDTAAAKMISPPFRLKGKPAERTVGRRNGRAPGQTALTQVNCAGIGDESLACMTEGREKDVGKSGKKQGPGTGKR